MSAQIPEISGLSTVLIGDFNPKIFQPSWFAHEGLIREKEADDAKLELIHPEVTSFELDWLRLVVTRNRFVAETTQERYHVFLRDLVISSFKLLKHTPLRQLGINTDKHYRTKSEEEWHEFGDKLTPKEIWTGVIKSPGMRSINIEGDYNRNGIKGHIAIRVEPSTKIKPGIYFRVNDHYEVDNQNTVQGANEIVDILEQSWSTSIKRSENIINTLLERK